MDDLISRQAVKLAIVEKGQASRRYKLGETWELNREEAWEAIDSVPSAQPEQRWIPCSERLPDNDNWEIVTVKDERGDSTFIYSDFGWYLDAAKCWIVDAEQRTDVIAWMPLPEPYKGE